MPPLRTRVPHAPARCASGDVPSLRELRPSAAIQRGRDPSSRRTRRHRAAATTPTRGGSVAGNSSRTEAARGPSPSAANLAADLAAARSRTGSGGSNAAASVATARFHPRSSSAPRSVGLASGAPDTCAGAHPCCSVPVASSCPRSPERPDAATRLIAVACRDFSPLCAASRAGSMAATHLCPGSDTPSGSVGLASPPVPPSNELARPTISVACGRFCSAPGPTGRAAKVTQHGLFSVTACGHSSSHCCPHAPTPVGLAHLRFLPSPDAGSDAARVASARFFSRSSADSANMADFRLRPSADRCGSDEQWSCYLISFLPAEPRGQERCFQGGHSARPAPRCRTERSLQPPGVDSPRADACGHPPARLAGRAAMARPRCGRPLPSNRRELPSLAHGCSQVRQQGGRRTCR